MEVSRSNHPRILVTGCAGFIGFHVTKRLMREGWSVIGLDNLNDYYPKELKQERLRQLHGMDSPGHLRFWQADLATVRARDFPEVDFVLHLAGQPGVRRSITDPAEYVLSNLVAFANLLEVVRVLEPLHFLFASSSSVYGATDGSPTVEHADTSHPVSFYAATRSRTKSWRMPTHRPSRFQQPV